MSYFGDMQLGSTINMKFTTVGTTGLPTQLAATTATTISIYPQSITTQITAGATLTTNFDGITGLNAVSIALTAGNGYTTANDYSVVLATGTVGGTNVLGYIVGSFSIENRFVNKIGTGAITNAVFATGAISATTFAAGAITSTVLAAGAIHSTIFTTGAIAATTFVAGAITATTHATGAIVATTFAAGAITSTVLAAGAIHSTIFTTGAIAATTFVAGAITSTVLAAGAIHSTIFTTGAIAATTFIAGAINATVIADGAIDAAAFAAGAITSTVLAAGAIHSTIFTTGSIAATTFIAGAITSTVLAAGAIHSTIFTTGAIAATTFIASAINATVLADAAIDAATFAAGAITSTVLAAGAIHSTIFTTGTIAATTFIAGAINATVLADSAIDRATFAADTGLQTIRSNVASAADATHLTLDSGASATSSYYNNTLLYITSGTGVGQARFVTAYDGGTQIATLGTAWIEIPASGSTFAIIPFDSIPGATAPTASAVATAVWDALQAAHVGAGSFGLFLDSTISGVQSDTDNIQARLPTSLVAGRIDASVGAVAANAITAAAIADGAIDAATFAAGAITSTVLAAGAIHSTIFTTGAITSTTFVAGSITSTVLADASIDRATFAVDTGLQTIRSNVASAANATSLTFDSGASATSSYYNNALLYITGGTGAGQARFITAYDGATQIATISTTWITIPASGSTFSVIPFDSIPGATAPAASAVATAVWDALQAAHVGAGSFGLFLDSTISGVQSDTDNIQTRLPAALVAGRIDASVGAVAADAITAASIANGAIDAATFAAGAITSTVLAAGAIHSTIFTTGAITSTTFVAGSITSTVLAAGAIHSTIFTTGAIAATTFVTGAIDAAAIANSAIDAATFAAGAITSTVLAAGAIHSTIFTTGAIAATTFIPGAITSTVLAAGAIHSTIFTTGAIVATTFAGVLPSNFSSLTISATGLVNITSSIKQNTIATGFMFVMTDMTTHAPAAGLAVVGTRSIDGSAFAATTNSAASVNFGTYSIDLSAADTNGRHIMYRFTNATADDLNIEIITQP